MSRRLVTLASLALCGSVEAMSVASYEDLARISEVPGAGRYIARASVETYFEAMAETISFLKAGTHHVYLQDRRFLCFPPSVNLSGPMLRGMFDGELKAPDSALKAFGANWKDYKVADMMLVVLSRSFPCPP